MSRSELLTFTAIHIIVPWIGFAFYALLCLWMKQRQIPSPPFGCYLALFFIFGSWLLVALTVLFWKWSGMATLGVLFLVFVAPFGAGLLALHLSDLRALSRFHRVAFRLSAAYSVLFLLAALWFTSLAYR